MRYFLFVVVLLVTPLHAKLKQPRILTIQNFGTHFEVSGEEIEVERFLSLYRECVPPLPVLGTLTPNDEYQIALSYTIHHYRPRPIKVL